MIGTFSSIATAIFSFAPGPIRIWLIPNGLSVRLRISRICFRASSGVDAAVARTPSAPALQTAATILGVVIQFIPASIMGCFMPSISVSLVLSIVPPDPGGKFIFAPQDRSY